MLPSIIRKEAVFVTQVVDRVEGISKAIRDPCARFSPSAKKRLSSLNFSLLPVRRAVASLDNPSF